MTKNSSIKRAMWLLNHGSARKFEIKMLKSIGIREIFLPKQFPDNPDFRSASIDFSEDANLSISTEELLVLNETNWYGTPSKEAWNIANKYFDVLFFTLYNEATFKSIIKQFQGAILMRGFGLLRESHSYSALLNWFFQGKADAILRPLGKRFWFAHAYAHQNEIEYGILKERAIFLPLGIDNADVDDKWIGNNRKIFFVCPHIKLSGYYENTYLKFKKIFSGLPYVIGGAQPIKVNDSAVLGYVTTEVHQRNMKEMRVMYYHSIEPNHIHYHPFEAIRAGMPLVYQAGGLLDKFRSCDLPGRCQTTKEARQKIDRILNGDSKLIDKIRKTQPSLLEAMNPNSCIEAWKQGINKINLALEDHADKSLKLVTNRKKRIAVILPTEYRGGTLRGAKILAQILYNGSMQAGEPVEIVFAYCEMHPNFEQEELSDLPETIMRRPFRWRVMERTQAERALIYARKEHNLTRDKYIIPEDNMRQFTDCDLWIIISDRLSAPLLPICPYIMVTYDYLQRYEVFLPNEDNYMFICAAQAAECILVSTEFTRQDAIHYAGLPEHRVHKLPMITPVFTKKNGFNDKKEASYFLWTTNLALHKNHERAFKALHMYYERYDGMLNCKISGVNTDKLLCSSQPYLSTIKDLFKNSIYLKKKIKILGELSDFTYHNTLANAQFLWHAARVDNGTFSVIEAAHLGVPSLSSSYPAMKEIDIQFKLNLSWMQAEDEEDMAFQLKKMELEIEEKKMLVPKLAGSMHQSNNDLAPIYWRAVRDYL